MSFPLISIIAPAALVCFFYLKRSNRDATFNTEAFFERERQANSVRKQPLTDLEYVEIDLSRIPFIETDNEIIKSDLETIKTLANQKIVNLSEYTNTDLKFKYGVANLTILTEYDQNYTILCRVLYDLGRELYSIEDTNSAVSVLEYGIDCGTDLKSHYLLLADIYEKSGQIEKIQYLVEKANGINSLLKKQLINELEAKISRFNNVSKELEDIGL